MNKELQENNFVKAILEMVDEQIIPGAAFAFVEKEEERFHYIGNLGMIEDYEKQEITTEALYDLASLTKIVGTTTRITQLIDQRKLTWETRICDVLVEFPKLKSSISQLLLHGTGLPADFTDKKSLTWERVIHYLSETQLSGMNQPVIYSDIGYLLLGLIIERIDQCDLASTFSENIFEPLEMTNTTFDPKDNQLIVPTEVQKNKKSLVGVVHDEKARRLGRPIGSAGLFSTLTDMVKFTRGMMLNRLPNGEQIVSSQSYEKITKTNYDGRSIGWEWLEDVREQAILYHTGFTGTAIGIDVSSEKALILLTNRVHPTRNNPEFVTKRKILFQSHFKGTN